MRVQGFAGNEQMHDITGALDDAIDAHIAQGAFYGPTTLAAPTPPETAGVFNLSASNGTVVMGSFGAKQATPSDRRLKHDITPAGTLPNGLKLYSWRYLGGSHRFTGVMAQDLLADAGQLFSQKEMVERALAANSFVELAAALNAPGR